MRRHIPALAATLALAILPTPVITADGPPATAPSTRTAASKASPNRLSLVFVGVNGGYQSNTFSFTDARSEPLYGETRSWTAGYDVRSGPVFDVGGGVPVWRNLAAGVCFSRFSDSRAANITGQVPHPFFFDQPRAISGESAGLRHEEQVFK